MEKNIKWIGNLRILATIAVIIIHSCYRINAPISSYTWYVSTFFDSLSRFCVPVFLMITGALLFPKEYALGDFFKKKFLKIIIPFLFWALFYITRNLFGKIQMNEILTFESSVKYIFYNLFFCSDYTTHLWYIYKLIGLYLFIPIIGKFVRNATKVEISYFLAVWILILVISSTKRTHILVDNFNLGQFSGFLGYLVLGYYLANTEYKWINSKLLSTSLLIVGFLGTFFGTLIWSRIRGVTVEYSYGYTTINVLLLSIGVFVLFKNLNFTFSPGIAFIRDKIEEYSFGIYLIHIFVLESMCQLGIEVEFWSFGGKFPIVGLFLSVTLCLTFSLGILYILEWLPLGKYITGVSKKSYN
jgi:surface polysaccharide O-acyltransferase-like enzyme